MTLHLDEICKPKITKCSTKPYTKITFKPDYKRFGIPGMTDDIKKDILNKIPLHRIGSPQDIADCVLFLLYKADYITGQIIAVDGGRSV